MSKQKTGFNLQNGLPNPKNIDLGALGVSPKRVEMPKGKVVGFDIERKDVLEYNDTLLTTDNDGNLVFDEMYTSLTFSPDKVLVRLFLQEPKVSKAGIMTYPNTPYETLAIQTEGGSGRMFQVTPECEVVWEYINPYFHQSSQGMVNNVFKANHYQKKEIPFLNKQ